MSGRGGGGESYSLNTPTASHARKRSISRERQAGGIHYGNGDNNNNSNVGGSTPRKSRALSYDYSQTNPSHLSNPSYAGVDMIIPARKISNVGIGIIHDMSEISSPTGGEGASPSRRTLDEAGVGGYGGTLMKSRSEEFYGSGNDMRTAGTDRYDNNSNGNGSNIKTRYGPGVLGGQSPSKGGKRQPSKCEVDMEELLGGGGGGGPVRARHRKPSRCEVTLDGEYHHSGDRMDREDGEGEGLLASSSSSSFHGAGKPPSRVSVQRLLSRSNLWLLGLFVVCFVCGGMNAYLVLSRASPLAMVSSGAVVDGESADDDSPMLPLTERRSQSDPRGSNFRLRLDGQVFGSSLPLLDEIKQKLHQTAPMTSSRYYIISNHLVPSEPHRLEDVTLVTTATSFNSRNIVTMAKMWRGPMSVSMYLMEHKGAQPKIVEEQIRMMFCMEEVRKYVRLHLIFETESVYSTYIKYLEDRRAHVKKIRKESEECKGYEEFKFLRANENSLHVYAVNIMRTVAIDEVRSAYLLTTNIDTFPSLGLRRLFNHIARQRGYWDLFSEFRGKKEKGGEGVRIGDDKERHKQKPLKEWRGDILELGGIMPSSGVDEDLYVESDKDKDAIQGALNSLDFATPVTDAEKRVRRQRQVFVIPAFELGSRDVDFSRIPSSKHVLIEHINKGWARNYDKDVWFRRQSRIKYTYWLEKFWPIGYQDYDENSQKETEAGSRLNKAIAPTYHIHPGDDEEFLAEPFYIVPRTAPAYDERFVRMAFDRRSHCLHMVHLRYRFQVLPMEYMGRLGFQTIYNRPNLARAFFHNAYYWDLFQEEMELRYGKYPKYE
eukprot:Nk52_evm3s324 gene=Nk52_evmTU3s324